MESNLPYVSQPGIMLNILSKVKEAKTPDRFTHDFLETKLGFKGGNYKQFIPLAKKLKLLNSDGSPTELYKKFRNPSTSKAAMAVAIKKGFHEVFDRNEYANSLNKEQFKGLVVEITGMEDKNQVVQLICTTFEKLKSLADFEQNLDSNDKQEKETQITTTLDEGTTKNENVGLNLSYTINLVLPKTEDPAVFNAIFKSLRDNLLKNETK